MALAVSAAPPERKPWQWSVEERLALRTNPEAAKARVSARGRVATTKAGDKVVDAFTGQTHPELFLPHEVFDELMQLAFLSKPRTGDAFRKYMMPEVLGHGLPADFWERLRNISVIYMADVHSAYDRPSGKGARSPQTDSARQDFNRRYNVLCRSRIEALTKARQEFGEERFNRFLYEVIAANMFSTSFSPTEPSALRQAEEGCR
ncbi:MAG TPA: hypothetical protein VF787_08185 [Thermoanaerobaculia bacterium]